MEVHREELCLAGISVARGPRDLTEEALTSETWS